MPGSAETRPDPRVIARRLEAWGAARGWAGSDPYDGLNATRLAGPLRRSRLGRRALTQLVKRSPINLRPLLGIRPERSAAAIANVTAAYARNGLLTAEDALGKLRSGVELLDRMRCPGFEEPCWGYHFDVQTRVFFYPRGAPNTIATAFAALALIDAHDRANVDGALSLAEGAGDFFLRHVPQTDATHGAFFGYLVGDRTPIHNANMLVGAVMALLSKRTGRNDFAEAARHAVAYTVAHQAADGSWLYGEEPHLAWIDGFHSGYVLECMMSCLDAGIDEGAANAVTRGLAFYRDSLFLENGTPKYTPGSTYPVDVQCVAQAIQTFSIAVKHQPSYGEWAWQVYKSQVPRLLREDGAFGFQLRDHWANRTPHVRWAAAPMLLALTHLIELGEEGQ